MKNFIYISVAFLVVSSSVYGSFGLEDALDVTVDAGMKYTDNRDSSHYNKISNIDYDLGLILEGKMNMQMTILEYYAKPYLRYREKPAITENYTKLFGTLGFDLKHRFSDVLTASVGDSFTYTDDQSVDRAGIGQVRGDESYILNRASMSVDYFMNRETKFNLSAYNTVKKYKESDVGDTSDRVSYTVDGSVAHQVSTTAGIEGILGYSFYDLASHSLPQKRDFASYLAAVGVYNRFTEQLTAGIKAGVQYQNYDDSDIDSNTSPYVSLWAKGYTIPTVRFNGEISHGVTDADDYPFTSVEYSKALLVANWDITPKFTLSGTGSYDYQDYDSSSSDEDLPDYFFPEGKREGSKKVGVVSLALTYKIKDACSISIAQRYEGVDSEVTETYTKNDSVLSLHYTF